MGKWARKHLAGHRHRRGDGHRHPARQAEREEFMVMSLESGKVQWWYYSALALCLVLFVGNWLFWVGFLKLSGELYCPGELSTFDLIIIGFLIARNLIRQMFMHF
jgi:hypothetical protein